MQRQQCPKTHEEGIYMKKQILIAYYSHSGNTREIAKLIQQQVGGTLCEIQPEVPYPTSYDAVVEQAKKEIQDGFRPVLKARPEYIELYDTVFIGSPNWWSTIAPPIVTFLSECDLSGKTVLPFCTHGGGGLGKVARDIAKLCSYSIIPNSFEVYGSGGAGVQAKLSLWLREVGIVRAS
jgi:flavodoxin